jgi:trigger factor
MKTSLEKTQGLGRKLTIEVPAEIVSSSFDRAYKGIQKNANIKGFRKGKAPLSMIKNMYADSVKREVLEDLISLSYQNALNEHSLHPVSEPRVNFDGLSEASSFNFTAEFEVRPEIVLKDVENLKVEKEKLDLGNERVESILTQIRESKSNLVPVFEDRPAKSGDVVEIDFVGTVEGNPLDGGSMNGYKLTLGSNSFIPGFEEGVEGMRVGQTKVLNLSFPADYGHKDIAGKPVQFDVTLKSMLKKDLPALTDEFVKTLGGYETVEDLRKAILEDVTEQESKRIEEDLKNRTLKALVAANPVEVPQTLLQQQKQFLIADTQKRMKQQGMSDEQYNDYKTKWDKDFEETAAFMIQSSFLVETIADKEKLAATKADFEDRLAKYSQTAGLELTKLKEFYSKNSERRHQMLYQITEEKVMKYLLSKAVIKEVSRDKLSNQ